MANVCISNLRNVPSQSLFSSTHLVSFDMKISLPENDKSKRFSLLVQNLVLAFSCTMVWLTSAIIVSGTFSIGMWEGAGISLVSTIFLIFVVVWVAHKYFKAEKQI